MITKCLLWASLVAQTVKNLPAMRETWVRSLGWEDPLEESVATHSSILAWRIPLDRGAWRATVHGVTKSQTRLSTERPKKSSLWPLRPCKIQFQFTSPDLAHLELQWTPFCLSDLPSSRKALFHAALSLLVNKSSFFKYNPKCHFARESF